MELKEFIANFDLQTKDAEIVIDILQQIESYDGLRLKEVLFNSKNFTICLHFKHVYFTINSYADL